MFAVLLSKKYRTLAIIPIFLLMILDMFAICLVNLSDLSITTPRYLRFSFSSTAMLLIETFNLKSDNLKYNPLWVV